MDFVLLCLAILGAVALVNWLVMQWFKASANAADEDTRARQRVEAEEREAQMRAFYKTAERWPAEVVWSYQMGMVDLMPNTHVSLSVEAPDGECKVEVEQPIEYTVIHRLADGSRVRVYVDPKASRDWSVTPWRRAVPRGDRRTWRSRC